MLFFKLPIVNLLSIFLYFSSFFITIFFPGFFIAKKFLKKEKSELYIYSVIIGEILSLPSIIFINFLKIPDIAVLIFYSLLFFLIICLYKKDLKIEKSKVKPIQIFFAVIFIIYFYCVFKNGFFISRDNFSHVAYIESIRIGRLPWDYPHTEAGEFQYYPFLTQTEKALIAKVSSLPAFVVSLINPLVEILFFYWICSFILKFLKLKPKHEIILSLLLSCTFLFTQFMEDIPKIRGILIITFFIFNLSLNKKEKNTFLLGLPIVNLSLITTKYFVLSSLIFLIYILLNHKLRDKKILYLGLLIVLFSIPWWLPLLLKYSFIVKNPSGAFVNLYLWDFMSYTKEPISFFLLCTSLIVLAFKKEYRHLLIYSAAIIFWVFHWIVSMPLLNLAMGSSFAVSLLQSIYPFYAVISLLIFEKKNKKLFYVFLFLSIIIFSLNINKYLWIFENPKELELFNLGFGMSYNQKKEVTEVYSWIKNNTDKEDVIGNIDEVFQGVRNIDNPALIFDFFFLTEPNSLLISSFTGRRVPVVNHNYFNSFLERVDRDLSVLKPFRTLDKDEICMSLKKYNISYFIEDYNLMHPRKINFIQAEDGVFYEADKFPDTDVKKIGYYLYLFDENILNNLSEKFPVVFENSNFAVYKSNC